MIRNMPTVLTLTVVAVSGLVKMEALDFVR